MKLRRTTMVITQRCTLKCKLCLAFIPYYKNPIDMMYKDAEKVIDNYFKIVDSVEIFSITGGEPLLNKDITKIMDKVYEFSDRIEKNIDIVTNGTLSMSEELLKLLSQYAEKTRVIISDYGDLSKKRDELIAQLEKWNINYRVQNYAGESNWLFDGWVDFSNHSLKHVTQGEVETQAHKCIFRQGHYYVINDGELHPCSRSYWRMREGIIPKDEKQYINLLDTFGDNIQGNRERLEAIEKLVSLNSCAYCNGVHDGVKRYKPAEQL